jgi:hypothetical protein
MKIADYIPQRRPAVSDRCKNEWQIIEGGMKSPG